MKLISLFPNFLSTFLQSTVPQYQESTIANYRYLGYKPCYCFNDAEVTLTVTRATNKFLRCEEMPYSQKWYKSKQQHLSRNQKKILTELWPVYGIDLKFNKSFDPSKFLNHSSNYNQILLDIGFGSGESILEFSKSNPQVLCIGVEIHKAGISKLLQKIYSYNITNIRIVRADVTLLLNQFLSDDSIDFVNVFFPDPWPNEFRDAERRVIRKNLLYVLSTKMKTDGLVRISTDDNNYANHVRGVMKYFENVHRYNSFDAHVDYNWENLYDKEHNATVDIPFWRPITNYELKAANASRRVWDFEYKVKKCYI